MGRKENVTHSLKGEKRVNRKRPTKNLAGVTLSNNDKYVKNSRKT